MNYFNYQAKGTLGLVWSLFSGLDDMTEEDRLDKSYRRCSYGHTLEIVNAALNGSLSLEDPEGFNLKAYEFKCQDNDAINLQKSVEKFLYIVDSTNDDDSDGRVGFGEISDRKLESKEEAYDLLECSEAFEENLKRLYNIRSEYIRCKGFDPARLLMNSLKGIPEAVKEVTTIVKSNKVLGEIFVSLCEDSVEGNLIQRLELIM